MKELDSARDSLLSLCTPAGQDALNLEVSQLYDLHAGSEREVRERLAACELRLEESDRELARMAGELRERAAALQWELRSLDQALSYSEPQNNIVQLQQHWHSLQVIAAALFLSYLPSASNRFESCRIWTQNLSVFLFTSERFVSSVREPLKIKCSSSVLLEL